MDYKPSGPFITSVLELKLNTATMFEWQKHSQSSIEVPHYQDLLEFIDLWAQASETSTLEQATGSNRIGSSLPKKSTIPNWPQLTSFITSTSGQTGNNCIACNDGSKHPLYACSKFKALSHENKLTLLKNSKLCFNCLKPGHFVKMCKSNQHFFGSRTFYVFLLYKLLWFLWSSVFLRFVWWKKVLCYNPRTAKYIHS